MKTRFTRVILGVLAVSLLAAACGDDDSDDTATAETVEESAAVEETTTTAMDDMDEDDDAAEADIVDTAVAAGDFTTLVAAIQAAGLEETLRGDGPFTVFAPTDDAFAVLPAGTVDSLLEEPEGALADILTYHVVEGAVMAADVVGLDGQDVTTVNGAAFTVNVGEDGAVTLTDAAGNEVAVTTTDIETSNGVIHVIDAVLMPG
ncbi:MAG: fasciclin domain-containing protein [Acidimicrobiales bacterium]